MKRYTLKSIINGVENKSSESINVVAPYNNSKIGTLHQHSHITELFKGSPKKFSVDKIIEIFQEFITKLDRNKLDIASVIAAETGSPIRYHLEDIENIKSFFHYRKVFTQPKIFTQYVQQPKGNVILSLSANEPIILTLLPAFAALSTGNRIAIKPSSKTPFFGYFLTKSLLELGFPAEYINYIVPTRSGFMDLIKNNNVNSILSRVIIPCCHMNI